MLWHAQEMHEVRMARKQAKLAQKKVAQVAEYELVKTGTSTVYWCVITCR